MRNGVISFASPVQVEAGCVEDVPVKNTEIQENH
jgi:hypothetical protein